MDRPTTQPTAQNTPDAELRDGSLPNHVATQPPRSVGKREVISRLFAGVAATAAGVYTFFLHRKRNVRSHIMQAMHEEGPIHDMYQKLLESQAGNKNPAAGKLEELNAAEKAELHSVSSVVEKKDKIVETIKSKYEVLKAHWKREHVDSPIADKIQEKMKIKFSNLPGSSKQRTFLIAGMAAVSIGTIVYLGSKWLTKEHRTATLEEEPVTAESHAQRIRVSQAVAEGQRSISS